MIKTNYKLGSLPIGIMFLAIFLQACTTTPLVGPNGETGGSSTDPCPDVSQEVVFQRDVMPIMSSFCAYSGCHNAASAADGIVLDSYQNVLKEVDPGDANNSELYESIIDNDPDDVMPPPPASKLTAAQITIIRDWINQGAKNIQCQSDCDTTTVTYSANISLIMQNFCTGCHNNTLSEGGINLTTHGEVQAYALGGSLLGSINHQAPYSIMPPSGVKLDQCYIDQIRIWIDNGALND